MSTWTSEAGAVGFLRGLIGRSGEGQPAARRWRAGGLAGRALGDLRRAAREERRAIDRFLADSAGTAGPGRRPLADLPLPDGTDWRWRPPVLTEPADPPVHVSPASGERLGEGVELFHDCSLRALIARQQPAAAAEDEAPFALSLEVFGLAGTYLSLALALPTEALAGLDRGHILRLDTRIEAERPVALTPRLNIVSGPNTDRLTELLEVPAAAPSGWGVTEFDLAETEINPGRLASAWVDLILDAPAMNRIAIRDLVLSRHRRAQI